jgi:hypothetical protein
MLVVVIVPVVLVAAVVVVVVEMVVMAENPSGNTHRLLVSFHTHAPTRSANMHLLLARSASQSTFASSAMKTGSPLTVDAPMCVSAG